MMLDLFDLRKLVIGYGKKIERGKKQMVKSINKQTEQADEIQIACAIDNKLVILDHHATAARPIYIILRTIISALVSCVITSGWSVSVRED